MRFEAITEFLEQARTQGIKLWVSGSRLHFRAPAGAMSAAFHAQLRSHREDIVSALSKPVFVSKGKVGKVPLLPSSLDYWNEVRSGLTDAGVMNRTHFVAKWIGDFDQPALQRSVQSLVHRHSILGSRVVESKGCFEFVFDAEAPCVLEQVDLSEIAIEKREDHIQAALAELVWAPFDLIKPLFRAFVVTVSEREHIAGFVIHHFIADGWSVRLASAELVQEYEHYCGRAAAPAAPLIQYSDYLDAMAAWLNSSAAEYRLSFWRRYMASAPCTQLPLDDELIDHTNTELKCDSFEFGATLTREIQELAGRLGITVFAVVLAANFLAFMRLSGASDLTCRVVVSGREDPELLGMIGNTITFLPVRICLSRQASHRELLLQVYQASITAVEHHVPCEVLQPVWSQVGASDISPQFNFINTATGARPHRTDSTRIDVVQVPAPPARSRLAVLETFVSDDGRNIRGGVWYLQGRYTQETVARFVSSFREAASDFTRETIARA